MLKQKSLKGSFSLCGKGLHTGLSLTVTFNPAPENTGYKIQRIDLEGMPVIDAIAENVVDTQRGTVLAKGDVRVSTVEHGLAALYALGIDNCLIQVNGPEFPILDGSAKMYVDKIKEVGIEEQNAPKDWYVIRKKIEVKDEQSGSCITILPDDEFSLTAMCSFESKFINSQFASLEKVDQFASEIAPARTFVFVRDIEPLLQANLIKGGDMDNAIVIYERQTTHERLDMLADMLKVEHRDANELGYIQHKPLVWENECTRHKLLDIIGDMALIGKPIKGRIIATRPGHTINNKFARQMRKEIRKHEIQAPIYDPNEEPVMDNIRIRELLPHRYPMQLVDKVIQLGATSIVGVKNITANEPFFTGAWRLANRGHGAMRRAVGAQHPGRARAMVNLFHENRRGEVPPEGSAGRHAAFQGRPAGTCASWRQLDERLHFRGRPHRGRGHLHRPNREKQITQE